MGSGTQVHQQPWELETPVCTATSLFVLSEGKRSRKHSELKLDSHLGGREISMADTSPVKVRRPRIGSNSTPFQSASDKDHLLK